jgi:hypothetical protein
MMVLVQSSSYGGRFDVRNPSCDQVALIYARCHTISPKRLVVLVLGFERRLSEYFEIVIPGASMKSGINLPVGLREVASHRHLLPISIDADPHPPLVIVVGDADVSLFRCAHFEEALKNLCRTSLSVKGEEG